VNEVEWLESSIRDRIDLSTMRLSPAGLERRVKWSTFNMFFLFLLLAESQAFFIMDDDLEQFQMAGDQTVQISSRISEGGSSEPKAKRGRRVAAVATAKEVGIKKEGFGAAKSGPLKKDTLEGVAWCTFHEKYEDVTLFSGKKASRCTPVRLAIEPGP